MVINMLAGARYMTLQAKGQPVHPEELRLHLNATQNTAAEPLGFSINHASNQGSIAPTATDVWAFRQFVSFCRSHSCKMLLLSAEKGMFLKVVEVFLGIWTFLIAVVSCDLMVVFKRNGRI